MEFHRIKEYLEQAFLAGELNDEWRLYNEILPAMHNESDEAVFQAFDRGWTAGYESGSWEEPY